MNLIIDTYSMTPIYEQIVDAVKKMILSGELKVNNALPSVRNLSRDLKISALTVKKAYDTLEEEGLTVSDHRTLIHVSNAEMNGYNSDYDLRQAITPDQVYQPMEGELTNLGWLFSYQAMGGPLTLERASEGSL